MGWLGGKPSTQTNELPIGALKFDKKKKKKKKKKTHTKKKKKKHKQTNKTFGSFDYKFVA